MISAQISKTLLLLASLLLLCSILVLANRELQQQQHTAIRRLDCAVFCRKTGFSGYVGGCQCGFTLFSKKRSQSNFSPQQPQQKSIQLPAKYYYPLVSKLMSMEEDSSEEVDNKIGQQLSR